MKSIVNGCIYLDGEFIRDKILVYDSKIKGIFSKEEYERYIREQSVEEKDSNDEKKLIRNIAKEVVVDLKQIEE